MIETATEIFDREQAMQNVGGDPEILAEIIALFHEDAPRLMAQVRQAVAEKEPIEVQRAAHALKGTIGCLGRNRACRTAGELEALGAERKMDEARSVLQSLENEMEKLLAVLPVAA